MSFSTLLRISRPRFRHYVLGPVLVMLAALGFFTTLQDNWIKGDFIVVAQGLIYVIVSIGYFTLPANLWIYGWNDIADEDTDKFNTKKGEYEHIMKDIQQTKKQLIRSIWFWNILYIVLGSLIIVFCMVLADCLPLTVNGFVCEGLRNLQGESGGLGVISFFFLWIVSIVLIIILLVPFWLLSYLYSCLPLRAKARPWIDGLMNILYIITPLIIGAIFARDSRNAIVHSAPDSVFRGGYIITVALPALCRCMAMHCYSAIPDIHADHQAGLTTTAVYLGKQKALIYCGILYLVSAIFSFPSLGWMSIIGGIVYLTMIGISYCYEDIFWLYKKFPLINLIIGFSLFRYIVLFV